MTLQFNILNAFLAVYHSADFWVAINLVTVLYLIFSFAKDFSANCKTEKNEARGHIEL